MGGNLFRAEESSVEASDTSGCSCSVGKFDKDVAILSFKMFRSVALGGAALSAQAHGGILVNHKLVDLAIFGFDLLLDVFLKIKMPVWLIFATIAIIS